jgi:hypothetical protein
MNQAIVFLKIKRPKYMYNTQLKITQEFSHIKFIHFTCQYHRFQNIWEQIK